MLFFTLSQSVFPVRQQWGSARVVQTLCPFCFGLGTVGGTGLPLQEKIWVSAPPAIKASPFPKSLVGLWARCRSIALCNFLKSSGQLSSPRPPREHGRIPVCPMRSWAEDFVKMGVKGTKSAPCSLSGEVQPMPLTATPRELLAVWLKDCSVFLCRHDCFYQTLHGRLVAAHGRVLVLKLASSCKCRACS